MILAPRCIRCQLRHNPALSCWRIVSRQVTAAVLAEHGDRCYLCGMPGANSADHKTPRSQWGDDSLANLGPAHLRCNKRRGTLALDRWFALYPQTPSTYTPSRDW